MINNAQLDDLATAGLWNEFNNGRFALTGDAETYTLEGAALEKAIIDGQSLDYLMFQACQLGDAKFASCYGNPLFFVECNLTNAVFHRFIGRAFFLRCDLTGMRFSASSRLVLETYVNNSSFWSCEMDQDTRRHLTGVGLREDDSWLRRPTAEPLDL